MDTLSKQIRWTFWDHWIWWNGNHKKQSPCIGDSIYLWNYVKSRFTEFRWIKFLDNLKERRRGSGLNIFWILSQTTSKCGQIFYFTVRKSGFNFEFIDILTTTDQPQKKRMHSSLAWRCDFIFPVVKVITVDIIIIFCMFKFIMKTNDSKDVINTHGIAFSQILNEKITKH